MKKSLLSIRALMLVLVALFTVNTWADDLTSPWTYTVKSGDAMTNSSITINEATWTAIDLTVGAGDPSSYIGAKGTINSASSQYGLKFGNSSKAYYSSYTLSTDYFANYNVTKVEFAVKNNGSKAGTVTVKQGNVTIGSTTQSAASSNLETLTVEGTKGNGGTLNITYAVAQASYVNAITVYFEKASSKTSTTTSFGTDAKSSYTVYLGETFTAPTATVTGGEGLVPTYSSSAEDVATVDASTGAVTLVGVGTTTIKASYAGNDTYGASSASYTLKVAKVYASLADLVADGTPTSAGAQVKVTLTNEKITGFFTTQSGSRNGVYLKSGDQEVELYKYGASTDWETGGKLSGTVTGKWCLYNGTWELAIDSWDALTYTAPVIAFTATDKNGKAINSKFATSPLTVIYNEYADGLTFKVNDADATYDAANGLTITAKTGSKANDEYKIEVYNGETLVAEQTYTWIPTATSVSTLKGYADGVEAILSMSNAKVSYASSDNKNVYIQDATRGILAYNLGIEFTAYTEHAVSIWGKKTTYNNVAEFTVCDSTATCSTVTPGTTAVTPTSKTVAQTLSADNQLTYVKISGAKITNDGSNYYAECGEDKVLFYDKFSTNVISSLETVPCYADVTCITSMDKNGTYELFPIAVENVSDKITGTCGGVTWNIDIDGNMVFTPTDGVSGTLATTGVAASKRPWASYVSSVKTVKFDAGVSATSDNSYMFKDMTNLESIDFTNFDTSAQTTMKGLFTGCSSLKSVNMSMLDLSKVTTFNLTFNDCAALESVNFGDNTLAAVTDFTSTFYSCHALKTIDLSKVTGAAVTKMATMFYDCTALETVDLRTFSTAKVSSANNAKNVFGTGAYAALPTTLIISKNFGPTAVSGTYIALPVVDYMSQADNTKTFKLSTDTEAQTALYAYNAGLDDYGTYVSIPTAINNVNAAETTVKAGKFVENGKVVIFKNGKKFNAAGAQIK